jgi:predicted nucleotide-binding protein
MSKESILVAKAAALKKNFDSIQYRRGGCSGKEVETLFPRYVSLIKKLKEVNPDLFSDIPELEIPKSIGNALEQTLYSKADIDPLVRNLDYLIELNAEYKIADKVQEREKSKRIFISHGRSKEWYKIQTFLERDLGISTLELAQEPNLGRTVLQKLNEESEKCSVAIIVMTGDDIVSGEEIRARENVMHEIGFFQGKYGLSNIILLHEEGVNIVYIGFSKDRSEATLGAITRELKSFMG